MQGSIGVMLLAVVGALFLVAGTSSFAWVAGICVLAVVSLSLEQRRNKTRHSAN